MASAKRQYKNVDSITPAKYLGKLYVDRHHGMPLDQFLIQKVVKIIQSQAPKKGKTKTNFTAIPASGTGNDVEPACLMCTDIKTKEPFIKTAVVNIISVGRIGATIYYITAGIEMKAHHRYWIRAFGCANPQVARDTISYLMEQCSVVQDGWQSTVSVVVVAVCFSSWLYHPAL
eukprot:m.56182 g.56182  ORF g.56182 m.56182 type:complete len:174 (+) comp15570_c0_seq3:424-945(+)